MKDWLLQNSSYRNYFLFYFEFNTGFTNLAQFYDYVWKSSWKRCHMKQMRKQKQRFGSIIQYRIAKKLRNIQVIERDSDWLFSSRRRLSRLHDKWLIHSLHQAAEVVDWLRTMGPIHEKTFWISLLSKKKRMYYLIIYLFQRRPKTNTTIMCWIGWKSRIDGKIHL